MSLNSDTKLHPKFTVNSSNVDEADKMWRREMWHQENSLPSENGSAPVKCETASVDAKLQPKFTVNSSNADESDRMWRRETWYQENSLLSKNGSASVKCETVSVDAKLQPTFTVNSSNTDESDKMWRREMWYEENSLLSENGSASVKCETASVDAKLQPKFTVSLTEMLPKSWNHTHSNNADKPDKPWRIETWGQENSPPSANDSASDKCVVTASDAKDKTFLFGTENDDLDNMERILALARLRVTYGKSDSFLCSICNKQFPRLKSLKVHLNLHLKIKEFKCEYCDKSYSNASVLRTHNVASHYSDSRKFECSHCLKKFVYKCQLRRHIFTHVKDLRRFMCSICEFRASSNRDLVYHKRIHLKKSINCDVCEQTFYCNSDLVKHQKIHSRTKDFTCEICQEDFSRSENLKRHSNVHSSSKYICKSCGANYAYKGAYSRHILKHTAKKTDFKYKDSLSVVLSLYS